MIVGGRAKTLQKANVNVIDLEKCQIWYKSQGKKTKLQENQMCAGHEQGGIDACWVRISHTNTFTLNKIKSCIRSFKTHLIINEIL